MRHRIHQPPKTKKVKKIQSFVNESENTKNEFLNFDQFVLKKAKLKSAGTT